MRTTRDFVKKASTLGHLSDMTPKYDRLINLAMHISNLPPSSFSNRCYRSKGGYKNKYVANGVVADGIGHAVSLIPDSMLDLYRTKDGDILFAEAVEAYFGIRYMSKEWIYMFDSKWESIDNSHTACAKRILETTQNLKRRGK